MKPVELEVRHPLRDPMGDVLRYNETFWIFFNRLNEERHLTRREEFPDWDERQRTSFVSGTIGNVQERLIYMYGRGDPIEDLIRRVQDDLPFIQEETEAYRTRWGALPPEQIDRSEGFIFCADREGFSSIAIALMLLPPQEDLRILAAMLNTKPAQRFYFLELLLKAFLPEWPLAKKYGSRDWKIKYAARWGDPVVRALALPPDARAQALAAYMKGWCRNMKPLGWKPVRDFSQPTPDGTLESLFIHFAYEVALAVCAYDIDDGGFRDHPYYPRDLVDHYRTHVRHTRDAWRPHGAGAGVAVQAPPPPKRADLAGSRRKGLARWVELASHGNIDAVDAVLEQVGKPRKVRDVSTLSCALAENHAGVHADIKDDETLENQLDTLAQARDLGEFEAPEHPPAGPARCEVLLLAGERWFAERGYRLFDLGREGDAWRAALVKAEYRDEFLALAAQLGMTLREPSRVASK